MPSPVELKRAALDAYNFDITVDGMLLATRPGDPNTYFPASAVIKGIEVNGSTGTAEVVETVVNGIQESKWQIMLGRLAKKGAGEPNG